MAGLTKLDGRTVSQDEVIAVIERDGGVIIEHFLDPKQLNGMRNDLLPLMEDKPTGKDDFFGRQTKRLSALFAKTCAFRGSWAVISRDRGHAFHGIAGSHFAPSGRLANECY